MAGPSPWPTIHAERQALIADLRGLTDSQWSSPSLCAKWTVRDVLGHITATARITPPSFFAHFAAAGFNFQKMSDKDVAAERQGSPQEALGRLETLKDATSHPPGPIDAMLGEIILHGEDIRRPLGVTHAYPTEALTRVADFYKGSNLLLGTKRRITGLKLTATDTIWSTGDGPIVSGPMLDLVLAMTGRSAGLAALSGDGVAQLAQRM